MKRTIDPAPIALDLAAVHGGMPSHRTYESRDGGRRDDYYHSSSRGYDRSTGSRSNPPPPRPEYYTSGTAPRGVTDRGVSQSTLDWVIRQAR
jgi:hypothetical protein